MNDVEVLLIEDNEDDGELAIRALKKNNLVNNLVWLKDGEEAMNYFFSGAKFERPKIVLLDLKLPKIGGLEILKKLKEHEHTKTIPVVVLTSSNQEPDILKGYDLGANSYIVKPVEFNKFADAISRIGYYWLLTNQPLTN